MSDSSKLQNHMNLNRVYIGNGKYQDIAPNNTNTSRQQTDTAQSGEYHDNQILTAECTITVPILLNDINHTPHHIQQLSQQSSDIPQQPHFEQSTSTSPNPLSSTPVPIPLSNSSSVTPAPDPTKSEHILSEDELFFVYDQHHISGPLHQYEILKKFIRNEISKKIWIKNVKHTVIVETDNYEEQDISRAVTEIGNYSTDNCNGCGHWCTVHFCVNFGTDTLNKGLKDKYPDFYNYIVLNSPKKYKTPVDIPVDAVQDETFNTIVIKKVGLIIWAISCIILLFHVICSLPIALGYFCSSYFFCKTDVDDNEVKKKKMLIFMTILIASLGLFITPSILVEFALLGYVDHDSWNGEWQSWMIAYILWGICSCLLINGAVAGLLFHKKGIINHLYDYLFWILGVEFDFRHKSEIEKFLGHGIKATTCVAFTFPALAAVAPSAIIGFIANYILEEKFVLECSEDIMSDYLCFGDDYGCCQVISSHDAKNVYAFIGGLTSNIVATWAVIRVIGYLMVNVSPEMAMFAKRNK